MHIFRFLSARSRTTDSADSAGAGAAASAASRRREGDAPLCRALLGGGDDQTRRGRAEVRRSNQSHSPGEVRGRRREGLGKRLHVCPLLSSLSFLSLNVNATSTNTQDLCNFLSYMTSHCKFLMSWIYYQIKDIPYKIYCKFNSNNTFLCRGFGKRHTVDSLEAEKKYSYRLCFKNNNGASEWSPPVTVQTISTIYLHSSSSTGFSLSVIPFVILNLR